MSEAGEESSPGPMPLSARIKEHPVIAVSLAVTSVVAALGVAFGTVDEISQTIGSWFSSEVSAADDFAAVDEDHEVTIDLLANDRGIGERARLTLRLDVSATQGRVALGAPGQILYTPSPDFFGDDELSYEIERAGRTSSARVRVEVRPVNDPPTSPEIHLELSWVRQAAALVDLVAPASDPEGDAIELADFSVAGTATQPTTAQAQAALVARDLSSPLDDSHQAGLAGKLFLPLDKWVQEAVAEGLSPTIRRRLTYTLRDARGAEAYFTAEVDIAVDTVHRIDFSCELERGRPPALRVALIHSSTVLDTADVSPGTREKFKLIFHRLQGVLYAPELSGNAVAVRANWSSPVPRFRMSCEPLVHLSSGVELKGIPWRIAPSEEATSAAGELLAYPETQGWAMKVLSELLGREIS